MGCSASKEVPSDPEQYGGASGDGTPRKRRGVKKILAAPLKRIHRTHSAGAVDSKRDRTSTNEEKSAPPDQASPNGGVDSEITAVTVLETHAARHLPDDIPYADEGIVDNKPDGSAVTNGHLSEGSTLQIKSRVVETNTTVVETSKHVEVKIIAEKDEQDKSQPTVTTISSEKVTESVVLTTPASNDEAKTAPNDNDDELIVPIKAKRENELPQYVKDNFIVSESAVASSDFVEHDVVTEHSEPANIQPEESSAIEEADLVVEEEIVAIRKEKVEECVPAFLSLKESSPSTDHQVDVETSNDIENYSSETEGSEKPETTNNQEVSNIAATFIPINDNEEIIMSSNQNLVESEVANRDYTYQSQDEVLQGM